MSSPTETLPSESLSNPGGTPLPVVALIVAEHEIVTVQVVDDTVNAAIALDVFHLRVATHGLMLVCFVEAIGISLVEVRLGLEQGDAETARLEYVHYLLDDVRSSLAVLRVRNVGLKGRIGAVRLGRDVHSKVVGRGLAIRSRNYTVGGEAAWGEEVCINASVRELALRIDIRQTARLGDNSSQGMAFGSQLRRQRTITLNLRIVQVGAVAEDIDMLNAIFLVKVAVVLFGHGSGVVKIKLLRILLLQIGHQDFQSLIVLIAGGNGSGLREVENLGLGLGKVNFLLGARRGSEQSVRLSQVQVPVLPVHLADHVGTAVEEQLVHVAHLVAPAAVRATLAVREQEVLSAVEDPVGGRCHSDANRRRCRSTREASKQSGNLQDARQAGK